MESDLGQLAAHFENNSMILGGHSSPFKFPKNRFLLGNSIELISCFFGF